MCLDFIGLRLLLIIMSSALMFLCYLYKLHYKRYQCYDGEKALNEGSYLLVKHYLHTFKVVICEYFNTLCRIIISVCFCLVFIFFIIC